MKKKSVEEILRVSFARLRLKNPLMLASGILGLDLHSLERIADEGAGAVVMKSLTSLPRKGHNNPILLEFEAGLMNAVGYANKGIDHGLVEFARWRSDIPLIGSIVASDAKEFAQLAEKMNSLPIVALEIPLSCPHTPGLGLLAGQGTPKATAEITKAVKKKTTFPLIVKLSPSVEPVGDIAKAAESEGADVVNMGNTLGPGMKINIERGQPLMDFKVGGLSGPAIKPVVIRAVYDIYKAVKIPIIATGGIMTGEDVIEAIMAGASGVQIGSGIYYRGMDIFKKIAKEMIEWMNKNNYSS
ncbi:dihydroorotate dehydrogenase, partial [Candidatus Roizmanbacteria bacterium]|nr:dihydroorotate dehydrogenase [Candidatus Roizmanbacteria bacterium]